MKVLENTATFWLRGRHEIPQATCFKCSCIHTFVFARNFGLRVSDIKVLRRLLGPKKRRKWRDG
jgi:hypothetical protein